LAFDFEYPQSSDNEARGWGPGWELGMPLWERPSSYPGTIVPLVVRGMNFGGGIRIELHDLAEMLIEESLDLGLIPSLSNGCYGAAFRPTKKSSGDKDLPPGDPGSVYTTTPSNHSWCTALDINSLLNVYGGDTHQITQEMADLWRRYGWRWLGPSIKDWQHFDFAGTPEDAEAMTEKAKEDGIGMALTDEQKETLKDAKTFLDELRTRIGSLDDKEEPAAARGAGSRVATAVLKSESAKGEGSKGSSKDDHPPK
jgi:hypothetical protein